MVSATNPSRARSDSTAIACWGGVSAGLPCRAKLTVIAARPRSTALGANGVTLVTSTER